MKTKAYASRAWNSVWTTRTIKYARGFFTCLLAVGMCATAAAQTVEWERRYDGPPSLHDIASAITVDGGGNVYVGGGSEAATGDEDYTIVKYAPDGTPSPTWPDVGFGVGVRRYDFVNNFDRVNAITVDEFGDVYVIGQFINEAGGLVLDEVVQVDFAAQGEQTEIRYLHLGVPDEKSAAAQTKAIQHTFETLDQMLTDRP